MRKHILFILLFHCLYAYSLCNNIDSIVIRYVSWEQYARPHTTSCVNFEYDVPYKEYTIKDRKDINELVNCLKNLKPTENRDFSVGCKLLFIKGNAVVKIVALNSDYLLLKGKTDQSPLGAIRFINDVISRTNRNEVEYSYRPDRLGNEFSKGRIELYNKLYKHLKKQKNGIKITGDTRLVAYCKVNKAGHTRKVLQLNIYNEELTGMDKAFIEENLYVFFNRIKWKKNNTRMECDMVVINFKFHL